MIVNTELASPSSVQTMGVRAAFDRYEEIRNRLPKARFPLASRQLNSLADVMDEFDGFLFDSFGVLNVGETAIDGAAECLSLLRRTGKRFCVLTNAASYTADDALIKYRNLKLDIRREEIVSSRDVTFAHLNEVKSGLNWGAIAADDAFADAGALSLFDLLAEGVDSPRAEGILFLSSAHWTPDRQDQLVKSLRQRPRPVLIGNPDLVVPRETGLTIEPGFWGQDIQDRTGIAPEFFGKPFRSAFDIALERMGPGRYAMIGDTLHTDILGGQAAGLSTILVTDHGLFKGMDVRPFIDRSGIVPDICIASV